MDDLRRERKELCHQRFAGLTFREKSLKEIGGKQAVGLASNNKRTGKKEVLLWFL